METDGDTDTKTSETTEQQNRVTELKTETENSSTDQIDPAVVPTTIKNTSKVESNKSSKAGPPLPVPVLGPLLRVPSPPVLVVPRVASPGPARTLQILPSSDLPPAGQVKKVITLSQQQLMDGSSRAKKTPATAPRIQSGVVQFSNPNGNGGTGQKIKIDLSDTILNTPTSILRSEHISRKLELPDKIGFPIPENENEDTKLSLECKEKLGDSPEKSEQNTLTGSELPVTQNRNEKADNLLVPLTEAPKDLSKPLLSPASDLLKPLIATPTDLLKPLVGTPADLLKPLLVAPTDLLKPLVGEQTKVKEIQGSLKVTVNEFGLVEIPRRQKDESKKGSSVPSSPRKDTTAARRIQDDNILCCEGCGCYGMAGEFVAQNSCSAICNRVIMEKVREKQKKEKEALKLKTKKDAKNQKKTNAHDTARETAISLPKTSHYNEKYSWQDPKKGFIWSKYLDCSDAKAAPVKIFRGSPFPEPHKFCLAQKLEAVDPQRPGRICVASVAEVRGARLRLHWDGYGDSYDWWENADSPNLHPAGWCERHGQTLVPPKGFTSNNFHWPSYLSVCGEAVSAPEENFAPDPELELAGWQPGMKVEAAGPRSGPGQSQFCPATVTAVLAGRILIHLDGHGGGSDFWAEPGSSRVRPVQWAAANKQQLTPPPGYSSAAGFSWPSYLSASGARAVPSWAFRRPDGAAGRDSTTEFRPGMRLEAVDRRNPGLVRVASVAAVAGRSLRIHYDGWPDDFDWWCEDDSRDLHPAGWADRTGHSLLAPLTPEEVRYWAERGGCPSPGCPGLGHAKGPRFATHHTLSACPYSRTGEEPLPDRLGGVKESVVVAAKQETVKQQPERLDSVELPPGRRRKKRKFFDDSMPDEKKIKEPKQRRESSESGGRNGREGSLSSASGSLDSGGQRVAGREAATQTESGPEEAFSEEWEERVRTSVFLPGYLPQPQPPGCLPFNWAEHSRILTGSSRATSARARLWTTAQVCQFVAEIPNIDHQAVADRLTEEEVDGESLLSLTQSDITSILEVKLGPAIKIYNAITALRMRKSDK